MAELGEPFDWNVTVVGAWNPAILTPDGVSLLLFKNEPGTSVNVEVSLGAIGLPRVRHKGLLVVPSPGSLLVVPEVPTAGRLVEASKVAETAMTALPATPVTAAGVNIRFRFKEAPNSLLEASRSTADDRISEGGWEIQSRVFTRTLRWKESVVNVRVTVNSLSGGATLEFNFHLENTDRTKLGPWISKAEQMVTFAQEFARDVLDVKITDNEVKDEQH